MLKSLCISEKGLVRKENQDRAGCFLDENVGLFVIADGMGGHYRGEIASSMVLETYQRWWEDMTKSSPPGFLQAINELKTVAEACHVNIKEKAGANTVCGTTLVLLYVNGKDYAVISGGDSRCYAIRKHFFTLKVEQLTHDDVTGEATFRGEKARKLTQALGAGLTFQPQMKIGRVKSREGFVLCSDGIYRMCPFNVWKQAMQIFSQGKMNKAAEKIKNAVTAHGAVDNYSLILVST